MQESLRTAWTKRLYKEYDHILWSYKIKLAPCVIAIDDGKTRLGQWNSLTRQISLSFTLLSQEKWEIVLEVLKHEMAHQMVSELYRSDEQHGPLFKLACQALGMESWAMKAELDLSHDLSPLRGFHANPEAERLLRQTEKLLALAQSSNQHESLAAMRKVQEIYANHHWEGMRDDKIFQYVTKVINHQQKIIQSYKSVICAILAKHFLVKVIYSSLYDAALDTEFKVIELLGTHENTQMAEYVYWFLHNQLPILWNEASRKPGINQHRNSKNSFFHGVLNGFMEKLDHFAAEKRPGDTPKSSQELIVIKSLQKRSLQELNNYADYRHPRLHRSYAGASRLSQSAFSEGKSRGLQLNLNKPLTSSSPSAAKTVYFLS